MIVVDASVAVKWLLPEDGSEPARELLVGRDQLYVPSIALVEVPSAVLRKLRAERLEEEEAKTCIALWNDIIRENLRVFAIEELLDRAIRIAISCRHPLIDCLYVAAAVNLSAELVTADVTLQIRCKRAHKGITLLGVPVAR